MRDIIVIKDLDGQCYNTEIINKRTKERVGITRMQITWRVDDGDIATVKLRRFIKGHDGKLMEDPATGLPLEVEEEFQFEGTLSGELLPRNLAYYTVNESTGEEIVKMS